MAKNYDHLFKVLLIGDTAVGKTCILCRFANDEFKTSHLSTIGIDFKMRTFDVEGRKVRLQMWDTAGQERYETITTQYYRRAQVLDHHKEIVKFDLCMLYLRALRCKHQCISSKVQGIMLVYDITRRKTFENIQKWINYVEEHAGQDVKTLIVGNKCDVVESKRKVSYKEGQQLSEKYGIPFFETSAFSNINIENAFAEMCLQILGHVDENIKQNGRKASEAIILEAKPETTKSGGYCCS